MDDLIEVCVKNMVSENFTEEQARSYMKELLPTLDYWKKYEMCIRDRLWLSAIILIGKA